MSRRVNFIFGDEQLKTLAEMAKATGGNVSETLRRLIPSPPLLMVLAREARESGRPELLPIEALIELAADGMKARMKGSAKPIDGRFIDLLSPEQTIEEYDHWLDAVADDAGLSGHSGQPSRYHLAKPPAGGTWEREGTGYAVLPKQVRFTPDGIEQVPDGESFRVW